MLNSSFKLRLVAGGNQSGQICNMRSLCILAILYYLNAKVITAPSSIAREYIIRIAWSALRILLYLSGIHSEFEVCPKCRQSSRGRREHKTIQLPQRWIISLVLSSLFHLRIHAKDEGCDHIPLEWTVEYAPTCGYWHLNNAPEIGIFKIRM